jgi:DNA-binding NtrC family response regulator
MGRPSVGTGETTEAVAHDAATTLVPGGRVYLLVRAGAEPPRVLELGDGGEVTLGRTAEATVFLDDPAVSRRHARIARRGLSVSVEDLGSRNGTLVGSALLRGASRSLVGGEVIKAGPAEIVVAVAAVAGAPTDAGPRPEVPALPGVIVADEAMVKVFHVVRRLAQVSTTVLIHGETGSGKEVVAEHLHLQSKRAEGPFVRLNCASLPEALLESELFGHEKASFTGADKRKIGYLEAASGGTLFLDEIGEIPLAMQAKLLRALESRRVIRVGGTQEIPLDVRLLCATHRDLPAEIAAGRFRQDFYYRISTFVLEVPPLRERRAEIALLAEQFAREQGAVVAPDALAALLGHAFPGNVRELKNAVEHALVLAEGGVIHAEHLPAAITRPARASAMRVAPGEGPGAPPLASWAASDVLATGPIREEIEGLERQRIEEALRAERGNQTRAAKRLGMSRRALIYKLDKYGIER